MGACLVSSFVGCYFCPEDTHIGNEIFIEIKDDLMLTGDANRDTIIQEAKKGLRQAEEIRKKIMESFETMFVKTGVCVLRQPNIERSILALIVHFAVLLTKATKEKNQNIKDLDLSLSSFFIFSKETPFLTINDAKIEEIKTKLGFTMDRAWIESKDSVLNCLGSINSLKSMFDSFKNQLNTTYEQVKKNYFQGEGNVIQRTTTSMQDLRQSASAFDSTKLIFNILNEVISSASSLSSVLTPQKVQTIWKIGEDACKKKIFDPKTLVFVYSNGRKCHKIEDWKENMCFIETSDEYYF